MSRRSSTWVRSAALAGAALAAGLMVLTGCGSDSGSKTDGETTVSTGSNAGTTTRPPSQTEPPAMLVVNGKPTLRLWLALTPEEREKGVNGQPLSPGEALGFGWHEPSVESFWMGGVTYPLVLAWVGLDRRVTGIRQMAPCPQADVTVCKQYPPPGPYRWAVELLPEDLPHSGLRKGATVSFEE